MFGVSGVLVQLTGDTLRWLRLTCRSTQSLEAGNNDLALGRIVQALSHSPYWKDTVIFVVEDDAQAGPDHTDSHRAPFYAISAYNRPGTAHRFINTTDVIAAIEDILGMGRLSKFDYFSRPLTDIFAPEPNLTPYDAIIPAQDLNEKNPQNTAAAHLSESLDLSAPDSSECEVVVGHARPRRALARAPSGQVVHG